MKNAARNSSRPSVLRYAGVIAARARTTSRLTPRPSYKIVFDLQLADLPVQNIDLRLVAGPLRR
jgi:hypothetical protein